MQAIQVNYYLVAPPGKRFVNEGRVWPAEAEKTIMARKSSNLDELVEKKSQWSPRQAGLAIQRHYKQEDKVIEEIIFNNKEEEIQVKDFVKFKLQGSYTTQAILVTICAGEEESAIIVGRDYLGLPYFIPRCYRR